MPNGTESVDVKLPSGETITTIVPQGWSDGQIAVNLRAKHPEFFPSESQQVAQRPGQVAPIPGIPRSPMEMVGAGVGDEAQGNAQTAAPAVRAGVNQLPAIGAVAGGALGSVEPGAGSIIGAGLGSMAGEQARRLIQRQPTISKEALTSTAQAGASGAAAEMGGQIIGKGLEGAVSKASSLTKQWQEINEAIGATKKSVIVPKSAETIQEAVKMPARGLQAEGFDAKTLSKMKSFEQQAAVGPKWNEAGRKVFQVLDDATQRGVRLNIQDSIKNALADASYDPQFTKRAMDVVQRVQDTYGISNLKSVSPSEAYIVRKALGESSNFTSLGDPKSASKVAASVYRGISDTMHSAVADLAPVDQHYADLSGAMDAINASAKKSTLKAPPTFLQKMAPQVVRHGATGLGLGAGGALTYELWKAIWGK